jgi:hypothetical protein
MSDGTGRGRRVAITVLVVVVALVLGAAAGTLGADALAGGTRAASAPREPASAPSGEPPLPQKADGFPNRDRLFLPGVTLEQVARDWLEEGHSWTCGKAPFSTGEDELDEVLCKPAGELKDYLSVDIEHRDTRIASMTATCDLGIDHRVCKTLLADFGAVALTGQPDQQKKAKTWVRRNMDSDSSLVLGGVQLWIPLSTASPRMYVLPAA